ncbi:MAG TPA: molybdopterin-guanine dinucleotide biosynthesis protein B [Stellaceae bacterium]|jgi:molybdopterin-guanine dinucleotide biosynthesis protein B|nr:molybdopterin-guanine dinucleotide biosynthesis protein B [Stellaceae bacterium]
MRVFGLIGWSGSGKTTLMTRLIPELAGRGIRVSTVKHAHHSFDVDQPGKDSFLHRTAGAVEVMVASANRWALMHEHRGAPESQLETLVRAMTPVDLLMIEGFKHHRHPRLEVHRPSVGKPLICREDPTVLAVASDEPIATLPVPRLELDDIRGIADFVLAHAAAMGPEPWPS